MKFIDLHSHMAWDIDDGIESRESSEKALQIAKSQGIEKIVATPHVIPKTTTLKELELINQRLDEFIALAKEYDIEAYKGCELFLNHDYLHALYDKERILINNTNYLLVEFDVRKELEDESHVEDYLYEISCLKHKVIIAHIERYFHSKLDLKRVQDLFDEGYIIQVNTTSLLGLQGKTVQKNAMTLIQNGLVHVIATDTHRSEGRRIPNMLETYELLRKDFDESILQTLMYDNPLAIIEGRDVEDIPLTKQSFLSKLFKKR